MKYTAKLIEEGLRELNFNPDTDIIQICTGNIFDLTRKMLSDKKISYKDVKIEEPLQLRVEQAFLEHLKTIGVKSDRISIESGKKRFFQLFGWISWDFHKRRKYIKSGFRRWQTKWEAICLEQYRKNILKKKKKGMDRESNKTQ